MAEYAENSNRDPVKKIVSSVYKTNNPLKDIPLTTSPQLVMNGKRITDLTSTVNWRQINQLPVVTKGALGDFSEQLWLVRNQFQVDRRLMNQPNNIQDPLGLQFTMWNEAFACDFAFKFINNTHETGDANAFVGLRARLDNPTKYGTLAAMKIDFGGVDISPANITKTTSDNFISILQSMLDEMNSADGEGVVFYMNSLMIRRFESALRTLGPGAGLSSMTDQYGRRVKTFQSAKIRDIGRKVDQSTPNITSTETSAGLDGASNYTSIYAVNYGADTFSGWQGEPLDLVNLGKDPTNGIMYNAVIDWGVGLFQSHNRAVCRGFNIRIS